MDKLYAKVDTVFVEVNDIDQAAAWYAKVFGFKLMWKDDEGGYAALEIGETPLTLVRSSRAERGGGHALFNLYAADIERSYEELQAVTKIIEPITDYGGVRSFDFQDPFGNILSVVSY